MCGIAGILSLKADAPPPTREQLEAMAGSLYHRGPDEFGLYRDQHAGFAHARLSIIDLTSGQQPLSNEDGTLWICFNGEIFNYVELRPELIARGHRFRTQSDTEVIVHAYEEWGDEAFAKFNGQYAIALWDSRREKMVLARDRVGVRPLYYAEHNGHLYFASEVKAIFAADRSIPRELAPLGLEESFTFWTVVPPRTVFQGVSEIRPGWVRTYERGKMTEREFWAPSYPRGEEGRFKGSLEDAVEATQSALEVATRLRMLRADVPVGSYLSGGLDSSIVAALGLKAKGDNFCTFSLRFEDAEYDETEFQRAMVKHIHSDHREVIVSRKDIAAAFPAVVEHAERPILRTAPAPLFLLSELVHQADIKVVLTGEGADEMFAGYDLFREAKIRRFWARYPDSKLRPKLLERLYPYLARSPVSQQAMARQFFGRNLDRWQKIGFSHEPRWHTTGALKRLFSKATKDRIGSADVTAELFATFPPELARWTPLAQDQYLEIRTLLSGYLLSAQGDRMLMAHSVEGRFPFLDANVIELAASLPASYKLHVLDEKHVLKRASAGLIPEGIASRKKQPYRAPDALSFVGPHVTASGPSGPFAWIEERMSDGAISEAGIFDPLAVKQLWTKCMKRSDEAQFSNADNMAVVGILSTQLLHQKLVRGTPNIRPIRLRTLVDRLAE